MPGSLMSMAPGCSVYCFSMFVIDLVGVVNGSQAGKEVDLQSASGVSGAVIFGVIDMMIEVEAGV